MIRPCVRRACIAAVALTCLAGAAKAQSHRSAEAENLATEGHTLVEGGRISEGCARLADSARLEPHTATMLWLAECSEKSGRLADAAHQLREAAKLARGNEGSAHSALERAAAIEAKLPRLAVAMAKPVPGLEVRRDGVVVAPGQLDVAVPVDVGEHTVSATAPGRRPWSTVVQADATGTTTVTVPELELATILADPASGNSPTFLQASSPRSIFAYDAPTPAPRSTGLKLATLSLGILGVASVGTGAFLGLRAKQVSDSLDGRCRSQNACDPNSSELRARAQHDALASTVAFGAGAAAMTAGALLWFLAPTKSRPKAVISPNVDFHRIAFTFSRTW